MRGISTSGEQIVRDIESLVASNSDVIRIAFFALERCPVTFWKALVWYASLLWRQAWGMTDH
jgi:hypothetical protein